MNTEVERKEGFHLVMKTAEEIIEFLYDKEIEPALACAAAGIAFATGCFSMASPWKVQSN